LFRTHNERLKICFVFMNIYSFQLLLPHLRIVNAASYVQPDQKQPQQNLVNTVWHRMMYVGSIYPTVRG